MRRPPPPPTWLRDAVVGLLAVAGALGIVAHGTAVASWELAVSRWFLAGPDAVARPLWLVMQVGGLVGGLVVGTIVLGARRGGPGVAAAAIAVLGAWELARLAKAVVDRGRPADYLTTIDTRFEPVLHGGGYPSGHACVAFALAALVDAVVPGAWRWAPWAVAALVGVGRLYFGAHLLLDVVGGAALGTAVGLVVRWAFVLDRPVRDRSTGGALA